MSSWRLSMRYRRCRSHTGTWHLSPGEELTPPAIVKWDVSLPQPVYPVNARPKDKHKFSHQSGAIAPATVAPFRPPMFSIAVLRSPESGEAWLQGDRDRADLTSGGRDGGVVSGRSHSYTS